MIGKVRVGCASGLAVVAAAVVLAGAQADTLPPTTTAPATAADTVATTTVEAPPPTTTEEAPAATSATTPPVPTLSAAPAPQTGCPAVGAVGLLLPHHSAPLVLAPSRTLSSASLLYPADGTVLSAASLQLDGSCSDTRPAAGTAQVRSLSLFGGVITARTATLSLTGGQSSVSGLRVGNHDTELRSGKPIRLGNWGFLLAPDPGSATRSALEIQLTQDRDGLPAGTLVFVPYARIPIAPPAPEEPPSVEQPATTVVTAVPTHDEGFARPAPGPRRHRKPLHRPLTITPPLHGGPYMFPVATDAGFADTYGGLRADVNDGWHHGDDLFAPLGTPVVAVADGTINRVGWQRLGGWRLWVRDRYGDQFYYAHLSGYTAIAIKRGTVHRGDVIGFVGNTGDAFTTLPHLHFEVHPRKLLHLHYDGAVDPTRYLNTWPHPGVLHPGRPVHPPLPHAAQLRFEASTNFRQLLTVRHVKPLAPPPPLPPASPVRLAPLAEAVRSASPHHRRNTFALAGAEAALAAAALGLLMWRHQRRSF